VQRSGLLLAVDYDLGTEWNEGTTVRGMADTVARLAPKVFAADETLNVLQLRGFTDFTHVRGNMSHGVAGKFNISRATAASINWSTFETRNLSRVLTKSRDGITIHPALRQAWLDFQAGR
jgi:hypothetical protein